MAKQGKNGGDIGFKDIDHLQPEFVSKVKKLKVGQVCPEVIKTQYGYHIVQVTGKEGPGYVALSEVQDQIAEGVLRRKQLKAIGDYLIAQHKSAEIKLSNQFQTLVAQDTKSGTTTK
jgi:parvulin-like peptidyl-prolyl isomerase